MGYNILRIKIKKKDLNVATLDSSLGQKLSAENRRNGHNFPSEIFSVEIQPMKGKICVS